MSSAFTVAEIALARLGLAALERADLDVVVGGLGLGYTAQAVLENPRVRSLIVVDALAEVIEWHEQGLLPLGKRLTDDPRCRLVHQRLLRDVAFCRRLRSAMRRAAASMRCWWISITRRETCCIRATPRCTQPEGLERLADHLHPGGVFALWSNDPPDDAFESVLASAFAISAAHVVTFDNASGDHDASNTVYVGVTAVLPVPKAQSQAGDARQ